MPRVSRYVQTLNKAQQKALYRIWDRGDLIAVPEGPGLRTVGTGRQPLTYKQFRKTVQFSFDCAMVHWCGMWLGIEQDGYTHS